MSSNNEIYTDFQLMFKPVSGRCNLDCEYCYYKTKHNELYPENPNPIISREILEKVFEQYLSLKSQQAEFSWQGGEPLLAGKEFFRTVVNLQQSLGHSGQIVGNALQTNGVLVDDEWCEFFKEYNFLVGLSVDGPERIHDFYRKFSNNSGSFAKVYRALNLLKKHNVAFNVLVTLNAKNVSCGADIYRFLVNSGVQFVQFIPILERTEDGGIADFSCPPDAYGRFMLDVFRIWIKRDKFRISVRLFDSILNYLIRQQATLCWNMPACPKAFIVEWNGDFYVCDHFVQKRWRMGNIMENSLAELAKSSVFDEFSQLKMTLRDSCGDCEFLPICNGGCPKHFLADERKNYFCESYKLFFSETLSEFKKLADQIRSQNRAY